MLKTAGFMLYGYNNFTEKGYTSEVNTFTDDLTKINCAGRSFIITGANSGLGRSVALFLAQRQGNVHMVCRDEGRGKQAFQEILDKTGCKTLYLHICDISEQADCRRFAQAYIADHGSLDVLINNAGVMLKTQQFTSEGICKVLATNIISNFLLTNLFLPLLQNSPDPRVIFVSSGGALLEKIAIGTDYTQSSYGPEANYAKTKRHQIALCEIYATLYPKIGFYTQHPGWTDTTGVETSMPEFYDMMKDNLRSVDHGSDTINWLAISSDVERAKHSGLFFRDRKKEIKHLPLSDTSSNDTSSHRRALWTWLSTLTGTGNFNANLRAIAETIRPKLDLSKHSSKHFLSLSSATGFKGRDLASGVTVCESLEENLLICQMLLDAGFIVDAFAKSVGPYFLFKKNGVYNWGTVPTDDELRAMVNDEWLNERMKELESLDLWNLKKDSDAYKVYQRNLGQEDHVRPTMVQYQSEASLANLVQVLEKKFIENHKTWNNTFDYGFVFRQIDDSHTLHYWRYAPPLIDARDFVVLRRIVSLGNGRVVIGEKTIEHGRFPVVSDAIRCDMPYQVRILQSVGGEKVESPRTPQATNANSTTATNTNDANAVALSNLPVTGGTSVTTANWTHIKGWIPSSTLNNANIDVSVEEVTKFCKLATKFGQEEQQESGEKEKEKEKERK